MPLHDYNQSLAVVMGTWDFDHLPPVPAAQNSLLRMEQLLTGPLCGWPEHRLLVLRNQRDVGEVPDKLIAALENITGIALFYYVGHGQIDVDDQLCLGLVKSRTEPNRRAVTSLQFQTVRRALLDSRAAIKIVILDCCFSGLANRPNSTLSAFADDVLDKTAGTGAYTIAATSAYAAAFYESEPIVERPLTFFTRYLTELVETGIPGEPSMLRLHSLFTRLQENLARDGRPIPTARSIDAARDFVFAHNAAPVDTHRDLDRELEHLALRLKIAEERNSAAEGQVTALQAEATERTEELRRFQEEARREASRQAAMSEAYLSELRQQVAETERLRHERDQAIAQLTAATEQVDPLAALLPGGSTIMVGKPNLHLPQENAEIPSSAAAGASKNMVLSFAARSDVGLLRRTNEDAGYAAHNLLAVADGLGGHAGGEVASAGAIAVVAALSHSPKSADIKKVLANGASRANAHLGRLAQSDPSLTGMATTLTVLLLSGMKIGLCHIGDARAYLLRDGDLSQLTNDHTVVHDLVEEGEIDPDAQVTNPQRGLVTRALPSKLADRTDIRTLNAEVGDRFLLCTDGLSDVVSDGGIRKILASVTNPDSAVGHLIDLAIRGGGPDNITCIVADLREDQGASQTPPGSPVFVGAATIRELSDRQPECAPTAGALADGKSRRLVNGHRKDADKKHRLPVPPAMPSTRHADLVVRRVEPWSVMKLVFATSVVLDLLQVIFNYLGLSRIIASMISTRSPVMSCVLITLAAIVTVFTLLASILLASCVAGKIEVTLVEKRSGKRIRRQALLEIMRIDRTETSLFAIGVGFAGGVTYAWLSLTGATGAISRFMSRSLVDRMSITAGVVVVFVLIAVFSAIANNVFRHARITLRESLPHVGEVRGQATLELDWISPGSVAAFALVTGCFFGVLYLMIYLTRFNRVLAFMSSHSGAWLVPVGCVIWVTVIVTVLDIFINRISVIFDGIGVRLREF